MFLKIYQDTELALQKASGAENVALQRSESFGDLSSAVSLGSAKIQKKNPLELAEGLAKKLGKIKYVEKVDVSKPGFINFHFDYAKIWADLSLPKFKKQKEKVIVEHSSINPNKAAHVGHLRNAVLGDTMAQVYKALGYKVEIQNYIDDTGVQVADTILGLLLAKEGKHKDIPQEKNYDSFDFYCWDLYVWMVSRIGEDEKLKERETEILKSLEGGTDEVAQFAEEVSMKIAKAHLETMARLGIQYDLLVRENDILRLKLWEKAFEMLKKQSVIGRVDDPKSKNTGAWIIPFGETEEEDKILVRSNGVPTYTAKDLAYHLWKFGLLANPFKYQKFDSAWVTSSTKGGQKSFGKGDVVISVIDQRQSYVQEVIRESLFRLGYAKERDHYYHLAHEVVALSPAAARDMGVDVSEKKSFYAMSGRKGIGVKADDLIDKLIEKIGPEKENAPDIAAGALRYYLMSLSASQILVFDFDKALQTRGKTGVYLQYAYARACSVLKKAKVRVSLKPKVKDFSESEKNLIYQIMRFEAVLEEAKIKNDPFELTQYAYDLADAFTGFYETSPILKAGDKEKKLRLSLVSEYKKIMAGVLRVLGIPALEKI